MSAYNFALQLVAGEVSGSSSSAPDSSRNCWKLLWSCEVPPTVNFFCLASLHKFPTNMAEQAPQRP